MILPTYRDAIRKLVPPWLQNGNAEKILYACLIQLDALGVALVSAVKLRFPLVYSAESLGLIGQERRIRRGLLDTDETYATRVRSWLVQHRRRGGAYALLEQLHAYFGTSSFPIELVYQSGARYSMATNGTITRDVLPSLTTPGAPWCQWRLFYRTDSIVTSDLVELALIPHEWAAAHVNAELIVLPTGAELWNYPATRLWNTSRAWNTTAVLRTRVN